MVVFDYMFYRIAMFYFKKDGSAAPRAVAIVTLAEILIVTEVIVIIIRQFYGLEETAPYKKSAGQIGGVIAIIVLILNYIRYRNWYSKFTDRWRNKETPEQRKLRGYLVVLGIFVPIALVVFLGTSGYRS